MKPWLRWSLVAGLPLAAVVSCNLSEHQAELRARAFCARFPTGAAMREVAVAARTEGLSTLRIIEENKVTIAHIGILVFSRHICIYEGTSGKVTKASLVHLD